MYIYTYIHREIAGQIGGQLERIRETYAQARKYIVEVDQVDPPSKNGQNPWSN